MTQHPLESYRKENGLTRPQFANMIGKTPTSVYRIERYLIKPSPETCEKIKEVTKGILTANDFMHLNN